MNGLKSILFLLMLPTIIVAQENISIEEIEWSIIEKINLLRQDNNLNALERAELLDAVAFSQTEYIAESGRLTHEQDDKKKEELVDRIQFFEAPYAFAGENISLFASNSKYSIEKDKPKVLLTSPDLVAQASIYSWLKEEDSKLNLLDSDFSSIGVSVLLNEKLQYAITVVIANPPYNFELSKKPFSFEGIKPYNKESCSKLLKDFPNLPELLSTAFVVEENKLYFEYPNLDFFNELISSSSDGLSAEIIFDDQFNCAQGNKLFPGEVTNGYLLPYSKKGKLGTTNLLVEEKKVKVELGELPAFYDPSKNEINGLIVKDGNKCETIWYNKIEFEDLRKIEIPYLFAGELLTDTTRWKDTLSLKMKMSLSKEEKLTKLQEFVSIAKSINFNATAINVERKVSPTSLEYIEKEVDSSYYYFMLDSTSSLDFNDMVEEVQLNKKIKNTFYELETSKLDSASKWTYLKTAATEDKDLQAFIDSINQINIRFIGEATISKDLSKAKKLELLNEAIESNNVQLAITMQRSLLENALENKEALPKYNINPNQNKRQLPLLNNEIVYDSRNGKNTYDGNPIHIAFLELYLIQPNQKQIAFNYLLSSLNNWGKHPNEMKSVEEWQKIFQKLRESGIPKELLAKLELYYNLLSADYYYEKSDFSRRKKALSAIIQLQKKANLTNDEILDIAKFFTFQDQFSMAVEIMKGRLNKEDLSSEFLNYFLQIAWYNPTVYSQADYLKVLIKFKDADSKSFCKLFSKSKRGIQPLMESSIKELYCKSCE